MRDIEELLRMGAIVTFSSRIATSDEPGYEIFEPIFVCHIYKDGKDWAIAIRADGELDEPVAQGLAAMKRAFP